MGLGQYNSLGEYCGPIRGTHFHKGYAIALKAKGASSLAKATMCKKTILFVINPESYKRCILKAHTHHGDLNIGNPIFNGSPLSMGNWNVYG